MAIQLAFTFAFRRSAQYSFMYEGEGVMCVAQQVIAPIAGGERVQSAASRATFQNRLLAKLIGGSHGKPDNPAVEEDHQCSVELVGIRDPVA